MSTQPDSTSLPGNIQGTCVTKASFANFEANINYGRRNRAKEHPQDGQTENPHAWSKLFGTLESFDETKIGSYKEDIDTLLVFAGLFSAVLAAFIVEAYKLLQPDSGQLSIQLLSHISQQLNSFSVNPSFVNSTFQNTIPVEISDFTPSISAFFVNLFWFLALILCLVTASLGMLVKQWLREYLANDSTSPEALARIRYSRHRSLEQWRVFSIASALPALLQLALILFLIALCLFVQRFHYALFCCITTAVAMFFVFYAFLMFAPLFSSRCPYKSPSLKSTTRSIRGAIHTSIRTILQKSELWKKWLAFLDPGPLVEESALRIQSDCDAAIWSEADKLFFDDRLVKDTIAMCLANAEGDAVVRSVRGVYDRRESKAEPANLIEFGQDSVSLSLTNALIREMRSQIYSTESLDWKEWMGEAYSLLLDNWQYCSDKIGKHHLGDFLVSVLINDWVLSVHILRWKPDVSLLILTFALEEYSRGRRTMDLGEWPSLHVLKQCLRSIKLLLKLGPLPPRLLSESSVEPTYNLIPIAIALLNYVPRLASFRSSLYNGVRQQSQELTSDVEAVIGEVIQMARQDLRNEDQNRNHALIQEGWDTVISVLDTLRWRSTNPDKLFPRQWREEFVQLHKEYSDAGHQKSTEATV